MINNINNITNEYMDRIILLETDLKTKDDKINELNYKQRELKSKLKGKEETIEALKLNIDRL
jgi:hypothetical protein